jgi:hypothetical protein
MEHQYHRRSAHPAAFRPARSRRTALAVGRRAIPVRDTSTAAAARSTTTGKLT